MGAGRRWLLPVLACSSAIAQITGVVTSAKSGQPIAKVTIMGEGLNWTESAVDGRFVLPRQQRYLGEPAESTKRGSPVPG